MSMSSIHSPIAELDKIKRVVDRVRELCRANPSLFPDNIVQVVLEDECDALAKEIYEVLRARVELRINAIRSSSSYPVHPEW